MSESSIFPTIPKATKLTPRHPLSQNFASFCSPLPKDAVFLYKLPESPRAYFSPQPEPQCRDGSIFKLASSVEYCKGFRGR